jgi:hypothetical protein
VRIIGKTKDYYDCMLSLDKSEDPVYVRTNHTEYVEDSRNVWWIAHSAQLTKVFIDLPSPPVSSRYGGIHCGSGCVAFCGKLYPFYAVSSALINYAANTRYCYSAEQVYRALQADLEAIRLFEPTGDARSNYDPVSLMARVHEAKVAFEGLSSKKQQRVFKVKVNRRAESLNRDMWKRFELGVGTDIGDEVFAYFKAPSLCVENKTWQVNPCLSDVGFQRVFDPSQAWQTISQYLGNNLADVSEKPNPVPDDLKAHAHGFNKKSFKNTKNRKFADRETWND